MNEQGYAAELQALNYLKKQGLKLVERNFTSPVGEIDLVMRDKRELVFVEVRYRSANLYGGAAASINNRKQMKLNRTALFYLNRHYGDAMPYCRFDLVLIDGDQLEWCRNVAMAGLGG